jgi:predicted YcjX-like family ATPase
MAKPQPQPDGSLYEHDFYAWTQDQAEKLRARAHNDIDWENVAEEIDSVGRSQKKEIRSRLAVVLHHLLKWEYQPELRSHSWQSTISEQRLLLQGTLQDSPSLNAFPVEALEWSYALAVRRAARETRFPATTFPARCPYSVDDILDDNFLPGPAWQPENLIRD